MSERLGQAFVEVLADTSEFARSLEAGAGEAAKGLGDALSAGLGEATEKIRRDLSATLSDVGTSLQDAGQRVSGVGTTLNRRVTLPLVGVGVAAGKTAMDFEKSFAQIEGLVGVTGSDLDTLREAAIRLGPQFGASGNQAAEALFFVTSAGLRGQDAIDALEVSLKASAVGLGDVSTIADLTTSIMNAYGAENVDAAKATDVLTAAVREGKIEPQELAGAMGAVLPLASAMGINIDEVGATFAAMSRTGTDANQAATQLRGIMTALLKPTAQAEEALEGMGLSSAGLREQIREEGLLSVLETLSKEFEGNDEAAAQVFGNVRALSGVLDLMGGNVEATRDIFANMTETTGILDNAFEVAADTASFQFAQGMAELKTAALDIGQILLPIIKDVIEQFRGVLEAFKNLTPEQREMVVRFAAIAAAVGPVLIIVGKLITSVGAIVKGVSGVITFLPKLGAAFKILGSTILANPIFLIGALLIGIGILVWKFREQIIDALVGAWEWIKEKVSAVFDWFRNAIASVIDWVKENWTLILAILTGPIGLAIKYIVDNWDRLRDTFTRIVQRIVDFVRTAFNNLRDRIVEAVQSMRDNLVQRFNAIVDFVRGIPSSVLNALGNLRNLLTGAGRAIMDGLLDGIKSAWNATRDFLSGLGSQIRNLKGPLSADRVLLEDIGEAIIGGLGRGMEDEWRNVKRQLGSLNAEIPMTVSAASIRDVGQMAGSTIGGMRGASSGTMVNIEVNNPTPEPASTSLNRELRKLSAIGVFGDD